MAVTYKKFFDLISDRNLRTTDILKMTGFSANILTRMRRNQYISMDKLDAICTALHCKTDDILDFIPDTEEGREKGDFEFCVLKHRISSSC